MKKISLTIIIILVASGFILSACTSNGTSAGLTGTSWRLVSYGTVKNLTPAAPGIETSLNLSEDGQASGNFGCNGFSGDYKVKNGTLVFGPLASTLMACAEPQMTQESTAFQVMAGTVGFEVEGNTLTIHDAGGTFAILLSRIENK